MNDLLKQISDFRFQISEGRARRGVTLIELLVVISIMMLLAAFALPQLAPLSKQRKIREAARSVNVFLSRARSRAIESGRPCGVAFHRVDTTEPLSNAVSMLYQAEVPPPYAGNTSGAALMLQDVSHIEKTPGQTYVPRGTVILKAQVDPSTLSNGIVRRGDLVQLNSQGPWYEIIFDTIDYEGKFLLLDFPLLNGFIDFNAPNSCLTLRWNGGPGCVSPWPPTGTSAPVSFKILRQPVRTIAQPLTLPVETTVDLRCSGTDQNAALFGYGQDDVIIMFSPNGSVGRYYYDNVDGNQVKDATEPIYLLIGWRDLIENVSSFEDPSADIDEEEISNWQTLSNLWIAISPQTGLITTAELANIDIEIDKITGEESLGQAIMETRKYARRAQSKGGR